MGEPNFFTEMLSRFRDNLMTPLAPEWPDNPHPEEDSALVAGTEIGRNNPIINKIWPGGMPIPGLRDTYNDLVRPATAPIGLILEGMGAYAKAPRNLRPSPPASAASELVTKSEHLPSSEKWWFERPEFEARLNKAPKAPSPLDDPRLDARVPQTDVTKRGRLFTHLPQSMADVLADAEKEAPNVMRPPALADHPPGTIEQVFNQGKLRYQGSSPIYETNEFLASLNRLGVPDEQNKWATEKALRSAPPIKYVDDVLKNADTVHEFANGDAINDMARAKQQMLPRGFGSWPLVSVDSEIPSSVAEKHMNFLADEAQKTDAGRAAFGHLEHVRINPGIGGSHNQAKRTVEIGIPTAEDIASGERPSRGFNTAAHELKHGIDHVLTPEIYKDYPRTFFGLTNLGDKPAYWNHPAEVGARTEGNLAEFQHNSAQNKQLTFGDDFIRPLAHNLSKEEAVNAVNKIDPKLQMVFPIRRGANVKSTLPPWESQPSQRELNLRSEKPPQSSQIPLSVESESPTLNFEDGPEPTTVPNALNSQSAAAQKLIELLEKFNPSAPNLPATALGSRVTGTLVPEADKVRIPKGFIFRAPYGGDTKIFAQRLQRAPGLEEKRELQQNTLARFKDNPVKRKIETVAETRARASGQNRHGRGSSKVNDEAVRAIRKAYDGGTSIVDLRKKYPNISEPSLREIAKRQSYRHIKD